MAGVNAELVTEFAKDKVWEESKEAFNNQAYLFGKQYFRISRCADKVDVIVTDSPLPLSIFYNTTEVLGQEFNNMVMKVANSYKGMNYLIYRVKPYNPRGRFQTEEESNELTDKFEDFLNFYLIDFKAIPGDIKGYDQIVGEILMALN